MLYVSRGFWAGDPSAYVSILSIAMVPSPPTVLCNSSFFLLEPAWICFWGYFYYSLCEGSGPYSERAADSGHDIYFLPGGFCHFGQEQTKSSPGKVQDNQHQADQGTVEVQV
jgi:hypothetical protein